MNILTLNTLIIDPVLGMMGVPFDTPAAKRMLRAIAVQESGLMHREQFPTGPARGWFQFERAGGVAGVVNHRLTKPVLRDWCINLVIPFSVDSVYNAIGLNDQLACACARLLLYTDVPPLPTDEAGGWECYLRVWRPGRPRPSEWAASWDEAGP